MKLGHFFVVLELFLVCFYPLFYCADAKYKSQRYFAEGGYMDRPRPCRVPWVFRGRSQGSNSSYTRYESSSPCINIYQYNPYIDLQNPPDAPEDPRTNGSYWCSTDVEYVGWPGPGRKDKSIRFNWGYCLDTQAEVATAPTQSARYYADGGYTSSPTPCAEGWTYRGAYRDMTNILIPVNSSCVSVKEFPPYKGAVVKPSAPLDNDTDDLYWCSTIKHYDPEPHTKDKSVRKQWGYCLDTKYEVSTANPQVQPTAKPTLKPTAKSTLKPTFGTSANPQVQPTAKPTLKPTAKSTLKPTFANS